MTIIEHNPRNLPSADAGRWTPILNGDVFCSPACGSSCKKADYDRTIKAANLLATKLGDGWEPEIWENGGWYYVVSKGDVTVRLDREQYAAEIKVDYISENHILSISHASVDPRQAVEGLVSKLSSIISRLSRAKSSATLELMSLEQ